MATQHAGLSPERWARFTAGEQILMVANEMNRGRGRIAAGDAPGLRLCYERVLALVDLTVEVQPRPGFRRELLRWRELLGELYVSSPRPEAHDRALRALLTLAPAAYAQTGSLFPPAR